MSFGLHLADSFNCILTIVVESDLHSLVKLVNNMLKRKMFMKCESPALEFSYTVCIIMKSFCVPN